MIAVHISVKYDDSMTVLRVHLVVMGIREKSMIRAANTDVHLKYDEELVNDFYEMHSQL